MSARFIARSALLALLALPVVGGTLRGQQPVAHKRILVLYWYGKDFPGNVLFDNGFRAALHSTPVRTIEYYPEYLETDRFPEEQESSALVDYLRRKYAGIKLDAVVASGIGPQRLLLQHRRDLFPTTPIVFGGVDIPPAEALAAEPGATGVLLYTSVAKTLDLALKLHSGTEHVFMVSGTLEHDRKFEILARNQLRDYQGKAQITYLTDLSPDDLTAQIKRLPDRSILLYIWQQSINAQGKYLEPADVLALVNQSAKVPIYGLSGSNIGLGIIGGYLFTLENVGTQMAELALRVADHGKASDIPVTAAVTVPIFDWRQLKRWNIRQSSLPPGSAFLNRQPTFWELYNRYILVWAFVLLAQTLVILALLWQRAQRRKARLELARSHDMLHESEERLRLAQTAARIGTFDWNISTGVNTWSSELTAMYGLPPGGFGGTQAAFEDLVHPDDREKVIQMTEETLKTGEPAALEWRIIWPDGSVHWIAGHWRVFKDPFGKASRVMGVNLDVTGRKLAEETLRVSEEKFSKAFREGPVSVTIRTANDFRYKEVNRAWEQSTGWSRSEVIGRTAFELGILKPEHKFGLTERFLSGAGFRNIEFTFQTKDGEARTGLGASQLITIDGEACVLTVAADITELKKKDALLRESEERFRFVANSAPVTIWMTDSDDQCIYVNQQWIEFTGQSFESQMGTGWTEPIHPQDVTRTWELYKRACGQRHPFRMEYRLRRHDGEYRWILDSGSPRLNPDGSFAGYIGTAVDITEHKLAEEALSSVSQKLVDAHEQERTWLARELHDDINQRLSLLAVSVDALKEGLPNSALASMRQTDEVSKEISDILNEIQALSHRLHTSKLDILGLGATTAGFCREIADRQHVEIDFHCDEVPTELPTEVALSLYRVLQEAVQNAIKHSGSKHFRVSLKRAADRLELTVHDSGVGFEPEKAVKGLGLGLSSMQERMRLIDGQLSIESKPHHGTTVRASVELTAEKVHTDETVSNQRASRPIAGCVKVLIVEDYEPFRRFVCAALQRRGDDFDLTEASDGLEAVRKAEELQPDLVLLDIGLPKLHGFEVAKRMRSLIPQARILFVSQESSPEVINEAFRLGGQGYVRKSHAHTDLQAAIDAVLKGERFIGSDLQLGEGSNSPARVLLAEDHPAMRDAIAKILRRDFDVVATVENGLAVLEAANRLNPDVLVMDVRMRGMEGTDVARQLTSSGSKAKVVFVSASMDAEQINSCVAAGGHAYVFKMTMSKDLPAAIRKVLAGEGFVSAMSRSASFEG